MIERPPSSHAGVLCGLALVLCLAGLGACSMVSDRPVEGPVVAPPPVRLRAGPWVVAESPSAVAVCYVTDRPVIGGARVVGGGLDRTERPGRSRRFHQIQFRALRPGTRYRASLLIEDGPEVSFPLQTLPATGPVRLLFVAGRRSPAGLAAALAQAQRQRVDAVVLNAPRLVAEADETAWVEHVFAPHSEALQGLTLVHPPEPDVVPEALAGTFFPGAPASESHMLHVGDLSLVLLSPAELAERNRFRLLHWLEQHMERAAAHAQVVLLPPPFLISGPGGIRSRPLKAFAPIFEKKAVDLVLSSRAPFYHRTELVGTPAHGLHYIALPGVTPGAEPGGKADFTAAQSATPATFLLETDGTGGVSGTVLPLAGGRGDAFDLPPERTAQVQRDLLLTAAWSRAVQRRELLAIVRQAAQAVENPEAPGPLRIIVTNRSARPLAGRLSWRHSRRRFGVEPDAVRFALEPGQASASVFQFLRRAEFDGMPVLAVETEDGLAASQALCLTRVQRFTVPRASAAIVVDGRADEGPWKEALAIDRFVGLQGQAVPGVDVRAWLLADAEGLCVRFRCGLASGASGVATVEQHDGPVWQDESVEVWLDPEGLGRTYSQFAVNTAGVQREANARQGRLWNPAWSVAVDRRSDRYNVEIRIPYRSLGLSAPPAAGAVWGVNLTRNDYTQGSCRVLQAAPTHGPNDRAGCYLRLRFP